MTVMSSSKRRNEPQHPAFTVADCYEHWLSLPPSEETPASYADYRFLTTIRE